VQLKGLDLSPTDNIVNIFSFVYLLGFKKLAEVKDKSHIPYIHDPVARSFSVLLSESRQGSVCWRPQDDLVSGCNLSCFVLVMDRCNEATWIPSRLVFLCCFRIVLLNYSSY